MVVLVGHGIVRDFMHELEESLVLTGAHVKLVQCPSVGYRHPCDHGRKQAKGEALRSEPFFYGELKLPPAVMLIDMGLRLRPII